jgi:hypothetical protein
MKHSQRKTKTYWKVNGGNRSYRSFDSHSLEATPQLTSDFRPSGDDAVNRRASPKTSTSILTRRIGRHSDMLTAARLDVSVYAGLSAAYFLRNTTTAAFV